MLLPLLLLLILPPLQLVCGSITFGEMDTPIYSAPARTLCALSTGSFARRGIPFLLPFSPEQVCGFNMSSMTLLSQQPLASSLPGYESFMVLSLADAFTHGCTSYTHMALSIDSIRGELREMGFGDTRTLLIHGRQDFFVSQAFENPLTEGNFRSSSLYIPNGLSDRVDILLMGSSDLANLMTVMSTHPDPTYVTVLAERGTLLQAFSHPIFNVFRRVLALLLATALMYAARELYRAMRRGAFRWDGRNVVFILALLSGLFSLPAILTDWCGRLYMIVALSSDLAYSLALSVLLLEWIQYIPLANRARYLPFLRGLFQGCLLATLLTVVMDYTALFIPPQALPSYNTLISVSGWIQSVSILLITLVFLGFATLFLIRRRQPDVNEVTARALLKLAAIGLISPLSLITFIVDVTLPVSLYSNNAESLMAQTTWTLVVCIAAYLIMSVRTATLLFLLGIVIVENDTLSTQPITLPKILPTSIPSAGHLRVPTPNKGYGPR